MDPAKLDALKQQFEEKDEWSQIAMVDGSGRVVYSRGVDVSEEEQRVWMNAFGDRDSTVGNGMQVDGEHFDVHRFFGDEGLIYGRRGYGGDGAGFCLYKCSIPDGDEDLYTVITYEYPVVSAKAIPELQELLATHLGAKAK